MAFRPRCMYRMLREESVQIKEGSIRIKEGWHLDKRRKHSDICDTLSASFSLCQCLCFLFLNQRNDLGLDWSSGDFDILSKDEEIDFAAHTEFWQIDAWLDGDDHPRAKLFFAAGVSQRGKFVNIASDAVA